MSQLPIAALSTQPLKPVYCGECLDRFAGRDPGLLGYINYVKDADGQIAFVTVRRLGRKVRNERSAFDEGDFASPRKAQREVYYLDDDGLMYTERGRVVKHASTKCPSCGATARVSVGRLFKAAEGWTAAVVRTRQPPRGTTERSTSPTPER